MPPTDFTTHAETVALFRYGLIADLRDVRPGDRTLDTRLEEKAAREYEIPGSTRRHVAAGTLRDWLHATARQRGLIPADLDVAPATVSPGGFDALKPRPRRDVGRARAAQDGGRHPPAPAFVLAGGQAINASSRSAPSQGANLGSASQAITNDQPVMTPSHSSTT